MNEKKTSPALRVLGALGKAVAYLALFLGCQLVVTFVVSVAISMEMMLTTGTVDPIEATEAIYAMTPLLTLISNLLTLGILLLVFLIRRKNPLAEVGVKGVPATTALTAVGVAPALYLVVTLVLSALPEAWLESYAEAAASLENTGVLAFISTALVAPVVEEVVFRGLILSRLRRAMPGWLALVLSAAVFGVCHGHPVWIAYAFVLGLVFGGMTLRSGSILPSMLAHIMFNATGEILSLVGDDDKAGIVIIVMTAAGLALAVTAAVLGRNRSAKAAQREDSDQWN